MPKAAHQKDIFAKSSELRDQLTAEQAKAIQQMYVDLANSIEKQAKKLSKKTTQSAAFEVQYLSQLKKQIEAQSKELANGLYTKVNATMGQISDAVIADNVEWLKTLGLGSDEGLSAAFSNVKQSVINAVATGSVYGKPGSWSLSKAIWGDNEKNLSKIYQLIAQGQAAQMGISDIADMISKYVNPNKKLDWIGPNGKKIYGHKVDYVAQRLVRTLSQHTYQQSIVSCAEDNPFITGFVWIANGSRVCDLCKKRDGKFFKKDELPLDHPNGMCIMRPVVKQKVVDSIAGWVKGTNNDPKIDTFVKKLGYNPAKKAAGMTLGDIKKKYGSFAVGKKVPQFQHKLPKDIHDQLKKLKQDSGMSWDDFFTKNFDGALSEKAKAVTKAAVSKFASQSSISAAVKKAHKFGGSFFGEDDVHKYLAKFSSFPELDHKGPKKFYDMLVKYYSDDYEALMKLQKAKKMSKTKFYKTYFWSESPTVKKKLEALQEAFYEDYDSLLGKLVDYYDDGDISTPSDYLLKYFPEDKFTKFSDKGVLKAVKKAPKKLQDDFVDFVKTYNKGGLNSKYWEAKDFDSLLVKHGYAKLSLNISSDHAVESGKSVANLYKKYGKAFMKENGLSFDDVIDNHAKAVLEEAKEQAAKKAAKEAAKKALNKKQAEELRDKLEKVLKDALVPSKNNKERLADALKFESVTKADEYHRKFVDKLWSKLTEREKYSIWEYTRNSNPINKPLSGYSNGSWDRSFFVGVGNVRWDTEDAWRYVYSDEFKKKFAKNSAGNVSYERVITDLTKAVQKSKLDDDVWCVRGSDVNGFAGMIDGDVLSYDDIKSIVETDPSQLSMLEGLEVTNHAFTSAGIASGTGFGGEVKYKVFLPKGTRAIYAEPQSYYGATTNGEKIYEAVSAYSNVGHEAEIILQRGTKFRINKIVAHGKEDINIELEVVGQPTFITGKEQTV